MMSAAPVFFPGLHQPSDAHRFERCCISINRVRTRAKPISTPTIIDSGSFMELKKFGHYRHSTGEYAAQLRRLHNVINIVAAVAQDYMCEPFILKKTGLTIEEHQRLTIERYDELVSEHLPFPIIPVLQGFEPRDYIRHIEMYGDRLKPGMWVGVGSICKRNGDPSQIIEVLSAVHSVRPDLLLHGFGIKLTSLAHPGVRELLYSADSMGWSYAARMQGRDGNSWKEAMAWAARVQATASRTFKEWQMSLPIWRIAALQQPGGKS